MSEQVPPLSAEPDPHQNCPTNRLFRLLAGEWTLRIVWILGNSGPTRFSSLRENLGRISSKVLTDRLKRLEGAQIVSRSSTSGVPPKVSYALTDIGNDVHEALIALEPISRKLEEAIKKG